jgi:hypothetical protein
MGPGRYASITAADTSAIPFKRRGRPDTITNTMGEEAAAREWTYCQRVRDMGECWEYLHLSLGKIDVVNVTRLLGVGVFAHTNDCQLGGVGGGQGGVDIDPIERVSCDRGSRLENDL